MNKAYIVIFEKEMTNVVQRKTLHTKLTEDKSVFGWWHYMNNTYIIITNNTVNATSIRKFIQDILPNVNHFALQIRYDDYDGYLDEKAWTWIEESLKRVY